MKQHKRMATLARLNDSFFSKCNHCNNIIPHDYDGNCVCGGRYQPIGRFDALRATFGTKNHADQIRKIANQKIPLLTQ